MRIRSYLNSSGTPSSRAGVSFTSVQQVDKAGILNHRISSKRIVSRPECMLHQVLKTILCSIHPELCHDISRLRLSEHERRRLARKDWRRAHGLDSGTSGHEDSPSPESSSNSSDSSDTQARKQAKKAQIRRKKRRVFIPDQGERDYGGWHIGRYQYEIPARADLSDIDTSDDSGNSSDSMGGFIVRDATAPSTVTTRRSRTKKKPSSTVPQRKVQIKREASRPSKSRDARRDSGHVTGSDDEDDDLPDIPMMRSPEKTKHTVTSKQKRRKQETATTHRSKERHARPSTSSEEDAKEGWEDVKAEQATISSSSSSEDDGDDELSSSSESGDDDDDNGDDDLPFHATSARAEQSTTRSPSEESRRSGYRPSPQQRRSQSTTVGSPGGVSAANTSIRTSQLSDTPPRIVAQDSDPFIARKQSRGHSAF